MSHGIPMLKLIFVGTALLTFSNPCLEAQAGALPSPSPAASYQACLKQADYDFELGLSKISSAPLAAAEQFEKSSTERETCLAESPQQPGEEDQQYRAAQGLMYAGLVRHQAGDKTDRPRQLAAAGYEVLKKVDPSTLSVGLSGFYKDDSQIFPDVASGKWRALGGNPWNASEDWTYANCVKDADDLEAEATKIAPTNPGVASSTMFRSADERTNCHNAIFAPLLPDEDQYFKAGVSFIDAGILGHQAGETSPRPLSLVKIGYYDLQRLDRTKLSPEFVSSLDAALKRAEDAISGNWAR